jgi:hypothetical protein
MSEPKYFKRALAKPADPVDRRDVPGAGMLNLLPLQVKKKKQPPHPKKGDAP